MPPLGQTKPGATLSAIHKWMNKHHPRTGRCEGCGATDRVTALASVGHTYTRNRADWLELCYPCHRALDGVTGRTHGLDATYTAGCRCGECREAHRLKARVDYAKREVAA